MNTCLSAFHAVSPGGGVCRRNAMTAHLSRSPATLIRVSLAFCLLPCLSACSVVAFSVLFLHSHTLHVSTLLAPIYHIHTITSLYVVFLSLSFSLLCLQVCPFAQMPTILCLSFYSLSSIFLYLFSPLSLFFFLPSILLFISHLHLSFVSLSQPLHLHLLIQKAPIPTS